MSLPGSQGIRSRKGQQDRLFAALIISDIMERYGDDPRREWLVNEETARWSVMTELGRLREQRGDETFWEAVEWTLENRPKVKDAVAILRSYRTGKSLPSGEVGLHREIMRLVTTYLSRHPGTSWRQVEEALRLTLQAVPKERA